MNKQRRTEINALGKLLLDVEGQLTAIREAAESLRDEEQDYLDNMPENFQEGEKGQAAEEVISWMDEVVSALEDIDIDTMRTSLEEAAQ